MAATWMSVGCSADGDSASAGSAATRAAVTAPDPKLFVVFYAATHDPAQVLAGVRAVRDDVPLMGCPTAGEIAGEWAGDGSVTVAALGGPGLSVRVAGARSPDPNRFEDTGAQIVAPLTEMSGAHRFALLLTDGQAGNQQDLLRGAYATLGAGVPIVGGSAANNTGGQFAGAPLLCDDRVLHGAVAASIVSDNPVGIGVRHGWERTDETVTITASGRNQVLELDGRPALEEYLTRLGAPAECWDDPQAFQDFSLLHPLGLPRPSGDEIRSVTLPDYESRAILSAADLPADSVAWLMRGDVDALLDAADRACEDALSGLGGRPAVGLLAFDCVGRRGVLAPAGRTDVTRMARHAGGASLAGFYSHGEIARTRGITGYQNQALVVLALS